MTNPRLRNMPPTEQETSLHIRKLLTGQTSQQYSEESRSFAAWIREKLGDDWIFDSPQVNPARIIEQASDNPFFATLMCKQACASLSSGHHLRVHDYIMAAYVIALALKNNELHMAFVAEKVKDGRSKSEGIPIIKFQERILNYLFIYIFAQSRLTSRNRAWQWADSIRPFFEDNRDPAEVELLLRRYGQEKLRTAANQAIMFERQARMLGM